MSNNQTNKLLKQNCNSACYARAIWYHSGRYLIILNTQPDSFVNNFFKNLFGSKSLLVW